MMFIISSGTWSSITCTGTRPPPCFGFSLTMIDNHRAVLFGGIHADYKSNDAYILDLATMVGKVYYFTKQIKTVLNAAFNVWIQYNVCHLTLIGG